MLIYNNRKVGKKSHINAVKRLLYNQLRIEEYEAITIKQSKNHGERGKRYRNVLKLKKGKVYIERYRLTISICIFAIYTF